MFGLVGSFILFAAFWVFVFPNFFLSQFDGDFYPPFDATLALGAAFLLWLIFLFLFSRPLLLKPLKKARGLAEIARNGHRTQGTVVRKRTGQPASNGYVDTELDVEFTNLSGTRVTREFSFTDS
ncbi:MAG: hypothetical protein Q4C71_05745, partial [Microbacteriaceae bacterium]|nr:hypothetical protein [Microbacteriaceae bacterium]